MTQETVFQTVIAEKDGIRVALDYIDEGRSGDYDKNDPDDIPLLRVYVEKRDGEDDWVEFHQDASTCLMLDKRTPHDQLQKIADEFLEQVLTEGSNIKGLVGGWTWINFTA